MQVITPPGVAAPTLGVIIVNYNYARFVVDAIESVLAQEPPFDEVIVVDDGSTDNSLEVITKFQPRVQVIAKANGGQLSASIAGITAARTDYVYILDADDYVALDFVRTIKPYLAENPAKVQFQLIGVDAEKKLLGSTFPTYSDGYGSSQMIEDNRIIGFYVSPPTSGNVYRRNVLTEMRLDLIKANEPLDGSPGLAVPYLGAVRSINRPLALYRVHGQNHSRWDQPDRSLLQGEIEWFYRRWTDVCNLLGLSQPPFGEEEPLYVLERRLMQSALENQRLAPAVWSYLRRLGPAHLPTKQKLMLVVWATGLILPMMKWRRKLVFAQRSPLNRSAGLKWLIGLLSGHQNLSNELESEASRPFGPRR